MTILNVVLIISLAIAIISATGSSSHVDHAEGKSFIAKNLWTAFVDCEAFVDDFARDASFENPAGNPIDPAAFCNSGAELLDSGSYHPDIDYILPAGGNSGVWTASYEFRGSVTNADGICKIRNGNIIEYELTKTRNGNIKITSWRGYCSLNPRDVFEDYNAACEHVIPVSLQ